MAVLYQIQPGQRIYLPDGRSSLGPGEFVDASLVRADFEALGIVKAIPVPAPAAAPVEVEEAPLEVETAPIEAPAAPVEVAAPAPAPKPKIKPGPKPKGK